MIRGVDYLEKFIVCQAQLKLAPDLDDDQLLVKCHSDDREEEGDEVQHQRARSKILKDWPYEE